MSATSGTSGTLGNAPPVSFPGVSSGIDYNSIIEKYTADTLQQEKPTQTQINNLNKQNTAILKITNLIGAVQDSLTALSDPTVFGAFKATVANTASGSPAATASQIKGQNPIAGTYTINAQTVATSTTVINNPAANGSLNLANPLDTEGTAITATNGTASNGKFTINGVQINYDVTTQTLGQIVTSINNALQANDGGSATLNANGTVTLTGVTSIGSGGDSGNLEQVLKLDTAQITASAFNPAAALDNESLNTQPTGTNVVNPATALNADDLKTAITGGQIVINGTPVAFAATDSLTTVINAINAAAIPGVTASLSGNTFTLTGVNTISDAGGGNLTSVLNLPPVTTPGASLSSTSSIIYTADVIVNGTSVGYDPTTDSLNAVLARITADTGVAASVSAGGLVTLGATLTSITDGPGSNFLQAFNLVNAAGPETSSASIFNAATKTVTSSSPIAGINQSSVLNQNNSAGFTIPVTSGTFTINGVSFTVDATKNSLSDLITEINSSAAGVTATYNAQNSSFTLTNKTPGPQSVLLGAGSDTSNFLSAIGLTANAAPAQAAGTTVAGTQASLTYTDASGQHTVFSATNDFTSAIPGIDLQVTTSGGSLASTFYTVTVAADPTQAEAAINKFIKAYNAAIQELNTDTVAPTVTAGTDATTGTSSSASSGGGVLYGNFQISGLRDQLVNLVSGFIPSGSTAYNSLQSVGIALDTASQSVGTTDANDTNDSSTGSNDTSGTGNNSFAVNATSGQLAALDTTAFEAAYNANTTAVQSLFTLAPKLQSQQAGAQPVPGSAYGFAYLLGSSLANIDGLTTFLSNTVITPASLANVLLSGIVDSNNQQIDSLQQQITLINREATQQADSLRQQFSASESQIAQLQALQSQIAAIGH